MNVNQALKVLGLRRVPDTPEELRAAYKEAASRWHPDKARVNGVDAEVASRNMSMVNQANTTLKGIMRLRSETRLGKRYSDPMDGQHYTRDEYGYIVSASPLDGIRLLISGLFAGGRRKPQQMPERAESQRARASQRKPTPRTSTKRKPTPRTGRSGISPSATGSLR